MDPEILIEEAFRMRRFSYTPYSGFKVGAALATEGGRIFTGCNIENSSFSPTVCAERTAFFKAVSEGETEFEAIAIVGGPEGAKEFDYCPPCGVCRQVMTEFCEPDKFKIILAKSVDEYKIYSLAELMPESFTKKKMK
ncbi:MAG: cytidine deaminase [Lachnospiraceae bacterium]|nr:cytidine deaminase [Lachnospiraceae bacterium]